MNYEANTRKEIRHILNQNIYNTINVKDFKRKQLFAGYIPMLIERGVLIRVGRGQYKILKEAYSKRTRKSRVAPTRKSKFNAPTVKKIRNVLNKNIGKVVSTQDFSHPAKTSSYLTTLIERGFVERVSLGTYKILKRVRNKRTGGKKGTIPACCKFKDLSSIPAILNSSKEGLVLLQIEHKYQQITPKEMQVNRNYLYRLLGYGVQEGIVKRNGVNKELRTNDRGPYPKRLVLVNKDITDNEWQAFVDKYIEWYSGQKKKKSTKKTPNLNIGQVPKKIINSFKEERNNPNKCYVESQFLKTVKSYINTPIECMAVTGPDYDRHISKLFSTIASKLTIVEHKHEIFKVILSKASICPKYIQGSVDLIKADVSGVISTSQYIDLDLMGTLKSLVNIISNHLRNQLYFNNSDSYKFLTFTASIRCDGGYEKRVDLLKHIFLNMGLNAKLEGYEEGIPVRSSKKLKFCQSHRPIISDKGRLIKCQIFTYQDTTPMLCVLLIYK